ncbi:MAG TPA: hypothetical protein VLB84_08925 [Bacteroidia bacterium]|jgi:hypothetical protein|nr:hypothetical protein [Bacteroidia bacterium]
MRIIANIPHPKLTISIFSMNDKYQVKFEAGPMEQTYKIAHSDVEGIEGIKKMVDDAFLEQILLRFNEMFLAFKSAKERLNP